MPERKITVFIYPPGETTAVPAGRFTHFSESGVGSFAYGRRYINRANALPVDPVSLPLGVPPQDVTLNGGLYGAFRDAAPDYWGRLVIASEMNAPPEALTEIDFLLAANATRVGNLDFRESPDDAETQLRPPHFNNLPDILEAAEKIESGVRVERHLIQLLRQGSSMGGARPKCAVEWNDALWIAKFPAKGDTLNFPRIEYATMTMAACCGIRIPEVRVIFAGGRDVFLTKRFDREKSETGWLRNGFISALTLMQWDERDRLQWDYPSVADVMRRYMGMDDNRELFRRMVFNIMARNTDDHPRNHGFLITGEKITLSPAYDIVPTPARRGVGAEFDLAMSIGDQGRKATVQNALSRCARFGLSTQEAATVINEIQAVVRNWREHFEECGASGHDIDMLEPSFRGSGEAGE